MRLIDADALKDYIDAQEGRPFIGCTVGEALKIMTDEQPTIQPKRGRWIHDGSKWTNRWICSECGYKWFFDCIEGAYCPNCGADMRGEEHGL